MEPGPTFEMVLLSELESWRCGSTPFRSQTLWMSCERLEMLQRAQQHYLRNLNTLVSKTHNACVRSSHETPLVKEWSQTCQPFSAKDISSTPVLEGRKCSILTTT